MRWLVALALLFCPSLASAQYRPADPVRELSSGDLHRLVSQQRGAVSGCASRVDTGAYVADVRTVVRPGSRPSTLYNARISVSVRSRPRDGELEGCVRRAVQDALRHQRYAVGRAVRAQQTFQVAERRDPPEPRLAPPWSMGEAQRVLRSADSRLARCLDVAGVPEQVTLHVAIDRTGRFVLQNADIPPGAGRDALACLTRTVGSLRTRGRPERRVRLTHRVAVRGRAY